MLKLITSVELPKNFPSISHSQILLSMGSCFAENIGALLQESFFRVDMNPFGILYNPMSVKESFCELLSDKEYTASDLFFFRECWHSPMHHGSFSSTQIDEALQNINNRLNTTRKSIDALDWILLTFGSAYVYEQKTTGHIVANCHKQPEKDFLRRLLSVQEIVSTYSDLLGNLKSRNPKLKVLFTISPIRHIRDGMHTNQISKSTLLLAVEQLQQLFPEFVFYFPSYEIMLDELRDYRYYADDMVHPSTLAIRYLWQRFSDTFFSPETKNIMEECESIRKALEHRPLHPGSEEYKRFLGQIVLKIERLNGKYPYLGFEKETELCHIRLNQ